MPRTLLLGTRGSPLARWQADRVAAALQAAGHAVTIVEIRTTGDLDATTPFEQLSDPNLFTRQIDEAMLAGRIDLGVHSLKDLPTTLPGGIVQAAVSQREDPRDALVAPEGATVMSLPRDAVVASSSLRRKAQLLVVRPDLDIVPIRGNVHTRLARVEDGRTAATLLAVAGLVRLGLAERISERIPFDIMLPAPGQAALAITARDDDAAAIAAARLAVNDETAEWCTGAERALLGALDGGCEVPVAAFASRDAAGRLVLDARVVSPDGRQLVEGSRIIPCRDIADALDGGRLLAEELVERGAGAILDELRAPARELPA